MLAVVLILLTVIRNKVIVMKKLSTMKMWKVKLITKVVKLARQRQQSLLLRLQATNNKLLVRLTHQHTTMVNV